MVMGGTHLVMVGGPWCTPFHLDLARGISRVPPSRPGMGYLPPRSGIGYPPPIPGMGYPHPDLEWGTPHPYLGLGYPSPIPGTGYPPRPGTGYPPDLGWGTPHPDLEQGTPHHPDLGWGTPQNVNRQILVKAVPSLILPALFTKPKDSRLHGRTFHFAPICMCNL